MGTGRTGAAQGGCCFGQRIEHRAVERLQASAFGRSKVVGQRKGGQIVERLVKAEQRFLQKIRPW